ncbi:MAG: SDR family NAD(P)-dependent oxidoreductase [Mycobacterium sp.]
MRVIVTGGNSGVGKATAGELAVAGHDVVIACRMLTKAHEAAARGRRTASRSWPTYFSFKNWPAAARPRTRQIPE